MKMLVRAALGLAAFFACAAVLAQATGMQIAAPAGYVPSGAQACAGADGKAIVNSPATPCPMEPRVTAATSTPQEGAVTSTAVTPTSGTATIAGGAATIGPLPPQLGRDIRVVLKGSWTGSFAIGTSSAANACAAGTINPLTIGGQAWGVYTGNANEVVDTPTLGATPAGTGAPVYCATATVTSGTLTYGLRQ